MSESESTRIAISSVAELQSLAPSLVERINADPRLALAAAANPLLALEELGYDLAGPAKVDFDERARFSKRQIVQRRALQKEVRKQAGKSVDVADPQDLRNFLQSALSPGTKIPELALPLGTEATDPLQDLKANHPALKPILELRALEARAPRFATRDNYQALRSGKLKLPGLKLSARMAGGRKRSSRPKSKSDG